MSRDGDQATAKVSWDGDAVTVEIKSIVTVMGDEDGLSTTISARKLRRSTARATTSPGTGTQTTSAASSTRMSARSTTS